MGKKLNFHIVVLAVISARFVQSDCPAEQEKEYSYEGANGPSNWGGQCNTGNNQSPIDIPVGLPGALHFTLGYFGYAAAVKGQIKNNGHTVQITPTDQQIRAILVSLGIYQLQQLHFHWGDGSDKTKGSEHTVNGTGFAMEMHLVHQRGNGQLAVIGVFFEETSTDNKKLSSLINAVKKVKYNGDEAVLPQPIKLDAILPKCSNTYYRYIGSLTTPPCSENVIWLVLRDPVPISTAQLKAFRKQVAVAKNNDNGRCLLVNNYRPVQPLNGRIVTQTNTICSAR